MKIDFKKWLVPVVLFLILAGAFAVRAYKFHDWLYFKMDQGRDSFVIANAVENGAGYLPLLGPRVGAVKLTSGFLRLGPIYYYFQYLSGKIFHSVSPEVFAYPDLFFSIASILLLYFFLKLYFSRYLSLLLVFLYSFSFLIIQYSRFSWNPNPMPFFVILAFWGLLKFFAEENFRRKIWWLLLWMLGLLIGSQLHFYGFFCLIGISGLMFLVHYRPWKKSEMRKIFEPGVFKKILILFFSVFLFFAAIYSPVIISDVMRKGENVHNFFEAIVNKPRNDKTSWEKLQRDFRYSTQNYCLILTSQCYKKDLSEDKTAAAFTAIIMLSGLFLAFWKIRREKDLMRRNFLWLSAIWITFFFLMCFPVAYQLRPRFFIFVFPVPFIFLGLIFNFLIEKTSHRGRWSWIGWASVAAVSGVVFLTSARGTYLWFLEQAQSQKRDVPVSRTLILKTKDGVTLGQLERSVDYIYSKKETGKPIYYYVKPEHVNPIKYLFFTKNDSEMFVSTIKKIDNANAQYYAIVPRQKGAEEKVVKKFGPNIKIVSSANFGQLTVFEIQPIDAEAKALNSCFNREGGESDRVYWKDVFHLEENPNAIKIDNHE